MSTFLFLCGCGDALLDQSYRGEPVHSEPRNTTWISDEPVDTTDLRLALFFNPGLPGSEDMDSWIELIASSTPISEAPSRVTFRVFELPT